MLSAVVLRAAETSLKWQSEAQLDLPHVSFFSCQVVKAAWFPFFPGILEDCTGKVGDVIIRGFASIIVEVNNPKAKSNYTHAKLYVTMATVYFVASSQI